MATLTTRCANCSTVFRVTPVQLQAHGGQVRCGRCMQVFNALEALAPEPPSPAPDTPSFAPSPPAAPLAESVTASSGIGAGAPAPGDAPSLDFAAADDAGLPAAAGPATIAPDDPTPAAAPETVAGAAVPVPDDPAPAPPDAVDGIAISPAAEPLSGEAATPEADEAEANPFMAPPPSRIPDPRRRRFAAASAALVLLLAAQAVFFYRSDIAARHAPARQWLAAVCEVAGCTVSLPQRPQSVLIEASDLQAGDPALQGRIQLTATLRNHAGHDVGYPALDLVLTNANDHALARRIFLPAEYLGAGGDPGAGLAANAEMTVRLALDTGSLGASGFRLAVLAAPQP